MAKIKFLHTGFYNTFLDLSREYKEGIHFDGPRSLGYKSREERDEIEKLGPKEALHRAYQAVINNRSKLADTILEIARSKICWYTGEYREQLETAYKGARKLILYNRRKRILDRALKMAKRYGDCREVKQLLSLANADGNEIRIPVTESYKKKLNFLIYMGTFELAYRDVRKKLDHTAYAWHIESRFNQASTSYYAARSLINILERDKANYPWLERAVHWVGDTKDKLNSLKPEIQGAVGKFNLRQQIKAGRMLLEDTGFSAADLGLIVGIVPITKSALGFLRTESIEQKPDEYSGFHLTDQEFFDVSKEDELDFSLGDVDLNNFGLEDLVDSL